MQTHSYKVLGTSHYLSGSLFPHLSSRDHDQNVSEDHGDQESGPLLSFDIHQVGKGMRLLNPSPWSCQLGPGHSMSFFPHPPKFSSDHRMGESTVPSLETQIIRSRMCEFKSNSMTLGKFPNLSAPYLTLWEEGDNDSTGLTEWW